ncbi:unnamed protein product [Amoebophrya sp. A120]|nr:unnamed protein product [Amoebophrya sp. A120]|eukprot:GSA120T00008976001.1
MMAKLFFFPYSLVHKGQGGLAFSTASVKLAVVLFIQLCASGMTTTSLIASNLVVSAVQMRGDRGDRDADHAYPPANFFSGMYANSRLVYPSTETALERLEEAASVAVPGGDSDIEMDGDDEEAEIINAAPAPATTRTTPTSSITPHAMDCTSSVSICTHHEGSRRRVVSASSSSPSDEDRGRRGPGKNTKKTARRKADGECSLRTPSPPKSRDAILAEIFSNGPPRSSFSGAAASNASSSGLVPAAAVQGRGPPQHAASSSSSRFNKRPSTPPPSCVPGTRFYGGLCSGEELHAGEELLFERIREMFSHGSSQLAKEHKKEDSVQTMRQRLLNYLKSEVRRGERQAHGTWEAFLESRGWKSALKELQQADKEIEQYIRREQLELGGDGSIEKNISSPFERYRHALNELLACSPEFLKTQVDNVLHPGAASSSSYTGGPTSCLALGGAPMPAGFIPVGLGVGAAPWVSGVGTSSNPPLDVFGAPTGPPPEIEHDAMANAVPCAPSAPSAEGLGTTDGEKLSNMLALAQSLGMLMP